MGSVCCTDTSSVKTDLNLPERTVDDNVEKDPKPVKRVSVLALDQEEKRSRPVRKPGHSRVVEPVLPPRKAPYDPHELQPKEERADKPNIFGWLYHKRKFPVLSQHTRSKSPRRQQAEVRERMVLKKQEQHRAAVRIQSLHRGRAIRAGGRSVHSKQVHDKPPDELNPEPPLNLNPNPNHSLKELEVPEEEIYFDT